MVAKNSERAQSTRSTGTSPTERCNPYPGTRRSRTHLPDPSAKIWAFPRRKLTGPEKITRACGAVFSEHEIRLNLADSEEGQILCPNCGSAPMEPYTFDLDIPVDEFVEEEEPWCISYSSRCSIHANSTETPCDIQACSRNLPLPR